jgi:hypothetical protein
MIYWGQSIDRITYTKLFVSIKQSYHKSNSYTIGANYLHGHGSAEDRTLHHFGHKLENVINLILEAYID